MSEAASDLDKTASELEEASRETAQARKRAWIADCGREGHNMQAVSYTHLDVYKRQAPALDALVMLLVGTVREVKAGDVHAGLDHFAQRILCLLYTSRCV